MHEITKILYKLEKANECILQQTLLLTKKLCFRTQTGQTYLEPRAGKLLYTRA